MDFNQHPWHEDEASRWVPEDQRYTQLSAQIEDLTRLMARDHYGDHHSYGDHSYSHSDHYYSEYESPRTYQASHYSPPVPNHFSYEEGETFQMDQPSPHQLSDEEYCSRMLEMRVQTRELLQRIEESEAARIADATQRAKYPDIMKEYYADREFYEFNDCHAGGTDAAGGESDQVRKEECLRDNGLPSVTEHTSPAHTEGGNIYFSFSLPDNNFRFNDFISFPLHTDSVDSVNDHTSALNMIGLETSVHTVESGLCRESEMMSLNASYDYCANIDNENACMNPPYEMNDIEHTLNDFHDMDVHALSYHAEIENAHDHSTLDELHEQVVDDYDVVACESVVVHDIVRIKREITHEHDFISSSAMDYLYILIGLTLPPSVWLSFYLQPLVSKHEIWTRTVFLGPEMREGLEPSVLHLEPLRRANIQEDKEDCAHDLGNEVILPCSFFLDDDLKMHWMRGRTKLQVLMDLFVLPSSMLFGYKEPYYDVHAGKMHMCDRFLLACSELLPTDVTLGKHASKNAVDSTLNLENSMHVVTHYCYDVCLDRISVLGNDMLEDNFMTFCYSRFKGWLFMENKNNHVLKLLHLARLKG